MIMNPTKHTYFDVAVAGGGLAGLSTAIQLARAGHSVVLVEKNYYPFHRVCGEYISEESRPFLQQLGVPFKSLQLPEIRKLIVSSPNGKIVNIPLNPGGFGISRHLLDGILAGFAKSAGVMLLEGSRVQDVWYDNGNMYLQTSGQLISSQVVVGSFGKRSRLDLKWKRPFTQDRQGKSSNYIGVKYHIRITQPQDTIALHNFNDGYCGVSAIEEGNYCLCYLTNANNLGLSNNSIRQMEERILCRNPLILKLFDSAEMIWKEPLSISNISFAAKTQVEQHVMLAGDAAGMITPLCGNGMSMALHGSKLLFQQVDAFLNGKISRQVMEQQYSKQWRHAFGIRLKAGRIIQEFFGDPVLSRLLVGLSDKLPGLAAYLVKQTHGKQF